MLATTAFPSWSWTSTVVSCDLSSKYGSSGTPTQTVTEPPPGRAACSTTGEVRRLIARTVQRPVRGGCWQRDAGARGRSASPHGPPGPADRDRRRDLARGDLDRAARARLGRDRVVPRAGARPARRQDPALHTPRARDLDRAHVSPPADRDCRDRRDVHPEARGRGQRTRAGPSELRARADARPREARLPRAEVPRGREGAGASERRWGEEGARPLGRSVVDHEE